MEDQRYISEETAVKCTKFGILEVSQESVKFVTVESRIIKLWTLDLKNRDLFLDKKIHSFDISNADFI